MQGHLMTNTHAGRTSMRALLLAALLAIGAATRAGCGDQTDTAWTHFPFTNSFSAVAADGTTLWIATQSGGVLEWDTATNTAVKYSQGQHCLPSNNVTDIAIAGDGSVWIATSRGAARQPVGADFQTPWEVFDSSNSPLPDVNITAVETGPDGTIWIGTFDVGLFHRLGDGTWEVFNTANSELSDNFVTSIAFDHNGHAWIGVWSEGVDRFDGARWSNFSPQNTFPGGTPAPPCADVDINSMPPDQLGLISVFVTVIGVDPVTGDVWFDNDDDGPCQLNGTTRFDGVNWFTYTNENSGALHDHHAALVRDAHGDLLFTSPFTFERFDGADWIPADADGNFVPGRDMTMIADDLWIASEVGTVVRISDGTADSFTPPGPADNAVWDVATITTQLPEEPPMDRNAIAWMATGEGVQRYDGVHWTTYTAGNSGLPSNDTRAVAQDLDGSLWFGSGVSAGLIRFDGQSWQSWDHDDGLEASRIFEIEVHPVTGEKWTVSDFGTVSRTFDGSSFINYTPSNSDLPGGATDLAFADDGSIWISTSAGLAHIVDDTWTIITEADGLPTGNLFAVAADHDGNVWVGSELGASMFDGTTWTTMQPAPALPSLANRVFELSVSANGDVWTALLANGVSRYDGASWTHFNVLNDGLISDKVQAFDATDTGELWMATFNGVMVFNGPGPVTCPTDLAGDDAETNVFDLLELLSAWGGDGPGADLAEPNDTVDVFDLLALLAGWGPCE